MVMMMQRRADVASKIQFWIRGLMQDIDYDTTAQQDATICVSIHLSEILQSSIIKPTHPFKHSKLLQRLKKETVVL